MLRRRDGVGLRREPGLVHFFEDRFAGGLRGRGGGGGRGVARRVRQGGGAELGRGRGLQLGDLLFQRGDLGGERAFAFGSGILLFSGPSHAAGTVRCYFRRARTI